MNALCVVSDSGMASKESSILNFRAIILCNSMEHPEANYIGTIVLTDCDPVNVLGSIKLIVQEKLIDQDFPGI